MSAADDRPPADDQPIDLATLPRYQQASEKRSLLDACISPVQADARFAAGLVLVERRRSRDAGDA